MTRGRPPAIAGGPGAKGDGHEEFYTYPAGALINTIAGDPGGNFVGAATGPSK